MAARAIRSENESEEERGVETLDGDSRTRWGRETKTQEKDRDIEDLKLGHPHPKHAGEKTNKNKTEGEEED